MARGDKRKDCEKYFKKGMSAKDVSEEVGCVYSYAVKVRDKMNDGHGVFYKIEKSESDEILKKTTEENNKNIKGSFSYLAPLSESSMQEDSVKNPIAESLNARLRKAEDEIYYLRQLLKATWEAE